MKQILIVVGVFAFIVGATVLAAYFGQGGVNAPFVDKGQRFTAKPGTTRENAVALTSNKRPVGDAPQATIARKADAMEDDSPLTVKSLSPDSNSNRSGPAHERAMEALNSGSPEAGLRMLNEALALPHDREQAALLYEAMGRLYAQLDPPDFDKATSAFEEALSKAEDPVTEQDILLKSVQVLMQGGLDDRARTQLEDASESDGLTSDTQFRLRLLQGQLDERAGNESDAELRYREVLEGALALPPTLSRDASLDLVRLAGLRLTQLYRTQERTDDVETLARELKRQLKTLADAA